MPVTVPSPAAADNERARRARVAVAGATGYAGQELVRILARHPAVTLTAAEISKLLPEDAHAATPDNTLRAQRESSERDVIQKELERAGWNVTLASKSLGIDRAHLHRKMKRLGIERPGGSRDE